MPERRHRAIAAAATASLTLPAAVLAARNWSDDNGLPVPNTPTWGAPANSSPSPGPTGQVSATSSTSPDTSATTAQGRLRSLTTGRCLAVDGQVTAGADIRLTACSSAQSEWWSYEFDGPLRSEADPSLGLAADPHTRTVLLSQCVVHSGEVSYTLSSHGELLLRWHQDLCPGAGAGGQSHRGGRGRPRRIQQSTLGARGRGSQVPHVAEQHWSTTGQGAMASSGSAP